MKALILAGGFGTRLRERVPDRPKPMADIAGRPFLSYLLDGLVAAGFSEAVLALGYQAELIRQHFGERYGSLRLRYVIEPQPLGTGGAMALALADEADSPYLVLNGDSYLACDYRQLLAWWQASQASLGLVLLPVADTARYGRALVADGQLIALREKGQGGPGLINAGIYLLRASLFERFALPAHFSFETDFLQRHCAELRPAAYLADGYFIDIGIPADYERAQTELPLACMAPAVL